MLFFSAVATGVSGLVCSGILLLRPHGRIISVTELLMALVLWTIFATLFIVGNFV